MKVVKFDKTHLDLNKRIYECYTCNKLFNWGEGCSWFGSYKDMEDDPSSIPSFCSSECSDEHQLKIKKK